MTNEELLDIIKEYRLEQNAYMLFKNEIYVGSIYGSGKHCTVVSGDERYITAEDLKKSILKIMFSRKHYMMKKKLEKIKEMF
jgi:hypothetical protein